MSSSLILTQNDFGTIININIKDINRNAISLEGSTVQIDLVFPDRTKKTYTLNIIDSVNGKVQLKTTAEMTSQVGAYIGFVYIANLLEKITLDGYLRYNVRAEDGGY